MQSFYDRLYNLPQDVLIYMLSQQMNRRYSFSLDAGKIYVKCNGNVVFQVAFDKLKLADKWMEEITENTKRIIAVCEGSESFPNIDTPVTICDLFEGVFIQIALVQREGRNLLAFREESYEGICYNIPFEECDMESLIMCMKTLQD